MKEEKRIRKKKINKMKERRNKRMGSKENVRVRRNIIREKKKNEEWDEKILY